MKINHTNGQQDSLMTKLAEKAKAKAKEFGCIFTPDDKSCPDITAKYAAKADDARGIENSLIGGLLKNGLENAKSHRNIIETGEVD